jgi:hypothetical protein
MKEFERWFVSFPLGDGRQAKAVFRQVDVDGGGSISRRELLAYYAKKTPHQLADLFAAKAPPAPPAPRMPCASSAPSARGPPSQVRCILRCSGFRGLGARRAERRRLVAQTVRNLAVTDATRRLLAEHSAVERCAAMLARAAEPDVRLAGALALINLAMLPECARPRPCARNPSPARPSR